VYINTTGKQLGKNRKRHIAAVLPEKNRKRRIAAVLQRKNGKDT
jgi:hypothetical protein